MNETNVVFTKNSASKVKSEESLKINNQNVSIQSRRGGSVVMNFDGTESEIKNVYNFFDDMNEVEPLKVNISGSGDVDHYFRGLSEMVQNDAGIYQLRVTLQFLSTTA